jgi:integrase
MVVSWKAVSPGIRRWGKTEKFQIRCSTGQRMREGSSQYQTVERTVHGTMKDAKNALAALRLEVDLGAAGRPTRGSTVEALLAEWLGFRVQGGLASMTAETYEGLIDHHINPAVGKKELQRLTARDLDRLYSKMLRDGLAPATVRKAHNVVRGALTQARKWQMVTSVVALDATPPSVPAAPVTSPGIADIQKLLQLTRDDHPVLGTVFALAVATGARRGELVALQWRDVDLERGSIAISRGIVVSKSRIEVKSTKTDRVRVVALNGGTVDLLRRHRTYCESGAGSVAAVPEPTAWVFSPRPGNSEPYRPGTLTHWFGGLLDAHGFTGFSWKDATRHFAATQLVGAGVDVRTVAGRLGHSNANVTLMTYSHWLPERDREAAETLGRLIEG